MKKFLLFVFVLTGIMLLVTGISLIWINSPEMFKTATKLCISSAIVWVVSILVLAAVLELED